MKWIIAFALIVLPFSQVTFARDLLQESDGNCPDGYQSWDRGWCETLESRRSYYKKTCSMKTFDILKAQSKVYTQLVELELESSPDKLGIEMVPETGEILNYPATEEARAFVAKWHTLMAEAEVLEKGWDAHEERCETLFSQVY